LYDVAAQHYGDGSKWQAIAQANGLTDPNLTGINTLTIPAIA
jgi:nucleoid-associated protein YgaU